MYLNEPQKELLVEEIRVPLQDPISLKEVMDAYETIRAKYSDVQLPDVKIVSTPSWHDDYDMAVEYERWEENKNYENELAEYQRQEKEFEREILTSERDTLIAENGKLEKRLYRLGHSNYDPFKLQQEKQKIEENMRTIRDKLGTINHKLKGLT